MQTLEISKMPIIKYYIRAGEWVAEFVDDAELFAMFGTTIIPTPFSYKTSETTVFNELVKKNPGCIVVNGSH